MNNRLLILVLTVAVAFSGMAGFFSTVNADDDVFSYSFYNGNSQGNTAEKNKISAQRVYIHPTEGPSLKYTVQGKHNGIWTNRSSSYVISNGTKASFTNSVFGHGDSKVRVKYVRTQTASTFTYGFWNPEPVGTYTIYN